MNRTYGLEWNGLEWNGLEWNGMVWNGMVWNGMVWNGMVWNGMVWNGMVWNGMEWFGMEWNGIDEPQQSMPEYLDHLVLHNYSNRQKTKQNTTQQFYLHSTQSSSLTK